MTNEQSFLKNPTDEQLAALANLSNTTTWSVLRRLVGLPVKGRAGVRIDLILQAEAAL